MKKTYLGILTMLLLVSNYAQNSLNFDGIDDKVNCGNNTNVQISGSELTLEAWIYPTSWKSNVWEGNIINKEQNSPDFGYMLRCGDGGKLNFNIGNNGWNEITSSPGILTLNNWQHVAGTYDGTQLKIYLNGFVIDSVPASLTISSSFNNLTIGNWSNSSNRCFDGKIEEVRIWNTARNESELNSTMNTEICTIPTDLVAYYRFNEGIASANNSTVSTVPDHSGNNNNGTLSNFTLSTTISNWVSGITLIPSGTDTIIECNSFTWIDGINYTTDNDTATFNIIGGAANGCDSIVTLDLTINTVTDLTTTISGTTITTNNTVANNYQWLDCNNNNDIIVGENGQSFTATSNGNFAVEITENGCVDTSSCVAISTVDILNINFENKFKIYPNPVSDYLFIETDNYIWHQIKILNTIGQIKYETALTNNKSPININRLPGNGIYFVQVYNSQGKLIGVEKMFVE